MELHRRSLYLASAMVITLPGKLNRSLVLKLREGSYGQENQEKTVFLKFGSVLSFVTPVGQEKCYVFLIRSHEKHLHFQEESQETIGRMVCEQFERVRPWIVSVMERVKVLGVI